MNVPHCPLSRRGCRLYLTIAGREATMTRRDLIAGTAASASGLALAAGPNVADLDRAAAAPVFKRGLFKNPVIIESVRLLRRDREYFVHVRSKDGAEGISLPNPPRPEYLDKVFHQLVAPFFAGKDARDLEDLLWELYRFKDNYKLQGIALWSPQAWV